MQEASRTFSKKKEKKSKKSTPNWQSCKPAMYLSEYLGEGRKKIQKPIVKNKMRTRHLFKPAAGGGAVKHSFLLYFLQKVNEKLFCAARKQLVL